MTLNEAKLASIEKVRKELLEAEVELNIISVQIDQIIEGKKMKNILFWGFFFTLVGSGLLLFVVAMYKLLGF